MLDLIVAHTPWPGWCVLTDSFRSTSFYGRVLHSYGTHILHSCGTRTLHNGALIRVVVPLARAPVEGHLHEATLQLFEALNFCVAARVGGLLFFFNFS